MAIFQTELPDSEKQVLTVHNETPRPSRIRRNTTAATFKSGLLLLLAIVGLVIYLPRVVLPTVRLGASYGDAKLGAVASESSVCSAAGIDMLKMGGNAADAMVATVFCVGVIGMYHSGIGGGGFMLIRSPDGAFESVDFRETAPAAAFQDMYKNKTGASVWGGLASGVPGEVRGLEYLHRNYGALSWSTVLQPAIRTARHGFPVTEDLVRIMESTVQDGDNFLTDDPTWALDFAPNGTRLGLGDIMTRRRYANTLETIAQRGPDAFYHGPIADTMMAAVRAANGTMTTDDLQQYTVELRAPSSGMIALSTLKIVEGYDRFFSPDNIQLSTHRLTEALRFAYGQRTNLGDPSFLDGMDQYEQNMLNETSIHAIRGKILDSRTQDVSVYDPDGIESRDTPGTSHIVTADRSGLAITLTTTINLYFGSRVMVPETGIIMNNEMNDFSIPGASNSFGYVPSPSNYIRPGKRPLSSITPMIVTAPDGDLSFVTGAAGGSRIITATIQSVINALDRGMTAPEALAEPRLHDQLIPNQVTLEDGFDKDTAEFMQQREHNVTWVRPGQSSAQCIRILPNGTFEAAGEPRQVSSGGFAI